MSQDQVNELIQRVWIQRPDCGVATPVQRNSQPERGAGMGPSEEFLKWYNEAIKSDSFQGRGEWMAWQARQPEIDELRRDNAALQAKIDSLMLEYCSSEMSKEQIEEWGSNQCAVDVKFTEACDVLR